MTKRPEAVDARPGGSRSGLPCGSRCQPTRGAGLLRYDGHGQGVLAEGVVRDQGWVENGLDAVARGRETPYSVAEEIVAEVIGQSTRKGREG